MVWYRSTWWSVVGVVAALTTPMAMLTIPASALAVVLVLAACVAVTVTFSVAPTDMAMTDRLARAVRQAILGGAGAMVAVGLVSVLGGQGVLVALVLAVSSPFFTERMFLLRAWLRLTSEASPALAEEPLGEAVRRDVPVADLSTPELVRAWRLSFNLLFSAPSNAARSAVVARRQQYLEELERRDPSGLQRWLASGARVSSDPGRYLRDL